MSESHVVYPIPIRPGLIVRIANLPDDLTKAEAEKIAAVVMALAEGNAGVAPCAEGERK